MLLAVDIGNTNITLGLFDNDTLVKTLRLESDIRMSEDEYALRLKSLLNGYDIDSCAIISVSDELTPVFKSACDDVFEINSFLCTLKSFDIKTTLNEPEKIGGDRLANAYAVMNKYPLPAIVVDIGTAITFDIVSKDKVFIGGVIMPGMNLQLRALSEHTSKLPLIQPSRSQNVIGDNTENAILSGVIRGTACAVEGLIKQCEAELAEPVTVIAAGGQCSLIAEYMGRKFDYINPNLTLEGLAAVYLHSHVNLY